MFSCFITTGGEDTSHYVIIHIIMCLYNFQHEIDAVFEPIQGNYLREYSYIIYHIRIIIREENTISSVVYKGH